MQLSNGVYPPGEAIYLELWMIGVIISAMVYGGVLSLSFSYVPLLLKTSHDISRRMRNFLLVYVAFMVAISTVYIITMIIALTRSIFHYSADPSVDPSETEYLFQNGLVGALCTTFANWGADWFMLWRCAMLYQGVSRPRRIALITVLVFMALMSLASGILNLVFGEFFFLVITGITVILNFVTAILITCRILYFSKYIGKAVGLQHNSPYATIIIICVESSALIVVFGLIYFILFFQQGNASYIPMQLLVHVYVMSPLLIVYRVASGRVVTIRQKPSAETRPAVSALNFGSELQTLSLINDENVEQIC